MYKIESEAKQRALELSRQDMLPDDAYVALFNKNTDSFCIYAKVSTLLFKAAKTGTYAGKDSCILIHDESGKLISAQTTVYRLVMDQIREFHGDEVFLSEYESKDWHASKPHMFLSKTALAVALRQAFPDVLAGLISDEEARCALDFGMNISGIKSSSHVVTNTNFDIAKPDVINKTPDSISAKVAEVFGSRAVVK